MSEIVNSNQGSIKDCHDNLVAFQKLIVEHANNYQKSYVNACAEVAVLKEQIEALKVQILQKKDEMKSLKACGTIISQVLQVEQFKKLAECVTKLKSCSDAITAVPHTAEQLVENIKREANK